MKSTASAIALGFAALLAAAPTLAQDTTAPATDAPAADQPEGEAGTTTSAGLSMGEPVEGSTDVGQPYVKEQFDDWQLRCVKTNGEHDPCQLYQLLKDGDGNPVSEFAIFPLLPPQGDAVAGGTIIAPLETLLPEGVRLSVDGSEARRYPFTFCTEIGCFARVGYGLEDINRFKAGNSATVSIIPVLAPDRRITLTVSLKGFTAGYTALDTMMKEIAAEAAANPPADAPAEGGDAPAEGGN